MIRNKKRKPALSRLELMRMLLPWSKPPRVSNAYRVLDVNAVKDEQRYATTTHHQETKTPSGHGQKSKTIFKRKQSVSEY